ncbi:hypothetical protein H4R20_006194, partial [Coemansia guatemalensis]
MAHYELFAHYLRYIFYSLLSRPDDYNSDFRFLMQFLKVPQSSEELNVPVTGLLDFESCDVIISPHSSPAAEVESATEREQLIIEVVVSTSSGQASHASDATVSSLEEPPSPPMLDAEVYRRLDILQKCYKTSKDSITKLLNKPKRKAHNPTTPVARKRRAQEQNERRRIERVELGLQEEQHQKEADRNRVCSLLQDGPGAFAEKVMVEFKQCLVDRLPYTGSDFTLPKQQLVELPWITSTFDSTAPTKKFLYRISRRTWQERFEDFFGTEP